MSQRGAVSESAVDHRQVAVERANGTAVGGSVVEKLALNQDDFQRTERVDRTARHIGPERRSLIAFEPAVDHVQNSIPNPNGGASSVHFISGRALWRIAGVHFNGRSP